MTDKEIQALKYDRIGRKNRPRLLDELHCREMINSIIAYGEESDLERGSYKYEAYIEEYETKLGLERVNELIAEQIADIKKRAKVVQIIGEAAISNSLRLRGKIKIKGGGTKIRRFL